jgi:hypothetical protein
MLKGGHSARKHSLFGYSDKVSGPDCARIPDSQTSIPPSKKPWHAGIAALLTIFLLAPTWGETQTISFGVSGGLPLNPLITSSGNQAATTGRYTFGPALQVALPRGLGLDVEFLYKRSDFGFIADPSRATAHRVELPLLLRYSFSKSSLHPFVHAGLAFNRVIAVGGADVCGQGGSGEENYCLRDRTVAVLRHRRTHGPVVGAGVEFRWGVVRLAPELRVTRWVDRNFGTRDTALRSSLTGIDLLLAARFR